MQKNLICRGIVNFPLYLKAQVLKHITLNLKDRLFV